MPDAARKGLTVHREVHARAMAQFQAEKKSGKTELSFIKWLSEYLLMSFERDDFLRTYAPFLEKIGVVENRIIIRDNKTNKLTEVFLQDKKLYCSLDETCDCIHIHFALALPELSRLKNND